MNDRAEHDETTNRSACTDAVGDTNSKVSKLETLQSKFPGILDYNKLKYMQLRHQFCDFVFLDVTWRAMQASGWSYHSTGCAGDSCYRTPAGTRQWSNPNDIRAALDRYAVKAIGSSLQLPVVPPAVNDDGCNLESIVDLRNDVCYHIQLLAEKYSRDCSDKPRTENIPTETSNNDIIEVVNSELHIDDEIDGRCYTRSSSKAMFDGAPATTTAVEKGSALYLHKKGRNLASKKKRIETKNGINSQAVVKSGHDITPYPSLSEISNLLQTFYGSNAQEPSALDVLRDDNQFSQWRHYLSTNHSLLLYGNGSKYSLLHRFCDAKLAKEGYVLELNGFDPDVSIDGILDLMVTLFLDGQEPVSRTHQNGDRMHKHDAHMATSLEPPDQDTTSPVDRAVRVAKALCQRCWSASTTSMPYHPIFLVVHSLEGPGLCTDLAQDALAALVAHSVPKTSPAAILRLVASINHIDAAAALWSTKTAERFSWIWQEVHTNRPYIQELAMLDDEDANTGKKSTSHRRRQPQQQSELQETRVVDILRHLAPRYGEVLQLLAMLQMKELQGSNPSSWVSFQTFKTACKSNFIIDKDAKLRALLTELTDHKMIISKTELQSEYVSIPFSVDKLKQIAAYKRVVDS